MEDETFEQEPGPLIPSEPAPPITSRFLFVDVAALRAKQLRRGALIRTTPSHDTPHKLERIAMDEVRKGLVEYTAPEKKVPETPTL